MGGIHDDLVASLKRAVAASPQDTTLRLHLAGLLLEANLAVEALGEINAALTNEPGNAAALDLLSRTAAALNPPAALNPAVDERMNLENPAAVDEPVTAESPADGEPENAANNNPGFDWDRAESELGAELPPPFVETALKPGSPGAEGPPPLEPPVPPVTLADVGGLRDVKQRLHESFLQPMKHADIAKAFGKSLRGGLLLYGPPGCGKTFLARAVAGELGASFISVTMTDVLDAYVGGTERNLHEVFSEARRRSPAVLFLDEVDALGMRRSSLTGGSAWLRQMVNQMLVEMDSTSGENDGLYILAATNHPWDLDDALLRPGRLDRMVLVTPPDPEARDAILRYHLSNRPIAGIDIPAIVHRTEGFSGADLEHICVTAAEKAMTVSIADGELRPIGMEHIDDALAEVNASTRTWLEQSRNVVRFANRDGRYNDLAQYLRSRKML